MSATLSSERKRAEAIERRWPAQSRSMAMVGFTEGRSVAQTKKEVSQNGLKKGGWGAPRRGRGTDTKHLQNDELVEYALGHSDLFHLRLALGE